MITFEELNMSPQIAAAINHLGFENPTDIQAQSIPLIMNGQDVVGESATGSGKTLAFGCGVIEHVEPGQGLQALVLTPTRELAEQVKDSIALMTQKKKLKITKVYGGVSINPQINELQRSEVVIATPGRLLDHIDRGTIDLSKIKLLILDEADRMLDMGFIDDVEDIICECPAERQNLFFSATISREIKELADHYMNDPVKVMTKNQVDPTKLRQIYYNVQKNRKLSLLVNLLNKEESGLAIVFCNTRRTTDFVVKNLKANKVQAIAIHGGLTQNKRSQTLQMFNDAKFGVLVCTDVAARGLHIDNVSHVYNYEIPNDQRDYVHRIGRTARAGEYGKVINLLCDYDHQNFNRVIRDYRDFKIDREDLPELERVQVAKVEDRGRDSRGGFGGRRFGGNSRGNSRGSSSGFRARSDSRDSRRSSSGFRGKPKRNFRR